MAKARQLVGMVQVDVTLLYKDYDSPFTVDLYFESNRELDLFIREIECDGYRVLSIKKHKVMMP